MPKGGKKFRSANQYVGKRKKKAGTKREANGVAAVASLSDTPPPFDKWVKCFDTSQRLSATF